MVHNYKLCSLHGTKPYITHPVIEDCRFRGLGFNKIMIYYKKMVVQQIFAYTRINGLAFKVSSVHIDCS